MSPVPLLSIALFAASANCLLLLPNTTGIDGQLTANLRVDCFFSLWLVFNDDNVKTSDEPFTIFAPQNSATERADNLLHQPDAVKKLLLDHVVLGIQLDVNTTTELSLKTLGGRIVRVRPNKEKENPFRLVANDREVIETKTIAPNGVLVVLKGYLFPEEQLIRARNSTQEKPNNKGSYTGVTAKEEVKNQSNATFVENILEVLSFLKSGVRVFQHFLSRSNVSTLLRDGEEYTVFVPTDHAFQRWHPIDWGFYPFSVPEFTENVIVNHFVKGRLKQETIKNGDVVRTLGGKEIIFKKTPTLTVNGATIVKGDTPVAKGNIMFIGEVLFVSESIVSKLHQQHKDKETPPLLAFPWFGAQFLSHAFLALERDKRFTQVTRFLNLADLAPHVSGTGYTFFVPNDHAFEELGLDKMPDNYLSTGDGLQILLNHFVKGRLYDKDLKDGTQLVTLGNKTIQVKRNADRVKINEATIEESEVFVYNLGTMFYINKLLFASINTLPSGRVEPDLTTTKTTTTTFGQLTTPENVEKFIKVELSDSDLSESSSRAENLTENVLTVKSNNTIK